MYLLTIKTISDNGRYRMVFKRKSSAHQYLKECVASPTNTFNETGYSYEITTVTEADVRNYALPVDLTEDDFYPP